MTERASLPKRWYQRFANIPIRVLLTVPFMLQLVGAVGIVGYLSAQSGQQSVRELANQVTQQVSLRIHDRLTTYLQAPQEVVAANHLAVVRSNYFLIALYYAAKGRLMGETKRFYTREVFTRAIGRTPNFCLLSIWRGNT